MSGIEIAGAITGLFLGIGVLVFLVVLAKIYNDWLGRKKSHFYREELNDLLVSGKLRQLAVEEEVDLKEEKLNLQKWDEYKKVNDYRIDNVIESRIANKIQENLNKK